MRYRTVTEATPARPAYPVVLATGFRPFFLAAGLCAAFLMPAWLLVLRGSWGLDSPLGLTGWHAHEMVFGYTGAVLAGFLLTATQHWTGRTTAAGWWLAGLVVLWLAGRIACSGVLPIDDLACAIVDLSFFPALAVATGRPIAAARSRRNFGFIGLLLLLALANLGMWAESLGWTSWTAATGSQLAVDTFTVIMLVVAGRIVPLFTKNKTGVTTERWRLFDWMATVAALALVVAHAGALPDVVTGLVAAVGAVAVTMRTRRWGLRAALGVPMLWVLHIGHYWIALAMLLEAAHRFGAPFVTASSAIHALTAGAIGTLTLGMMFRVSLGHTGRPIEASRWVIAAFCVMLGAGLVRVALPMLGSGFYQHALRISGVAFGLALLLFVVLMTPVLLTARPDGKPG